jgi:hypothetical protein
VDWLFDQALDDVSINLIILLSSPETKVLTDELLCLINILKKIIIFYGNFPNFKK